MPAEAEGRHVGVSCGEPILQALHHIGVVKFLAEGAEWRRERVGALAGRAYGMAPPAQIFQHRFGPLLLRIERVPGRAQALEREAE